MKKICLFFILLILPICVYAEDLNLAENAKSAILIEASTGEIIYQKNANERLAPASMTKIMSLILIMENIENGNLNWNDIVVVSKNAASMGGSHNLNWNDIVVVSKNAASMGGSQIFLEQNEMMSVEDLVKEICVASGNDVTVTKKQSYVISVKMQITMMRESIT